MSNVLRLASLPLQQFQYNIHDQLIKCTVTGCYNADYVNVKERILDVSKFASPRHYWTWVLFVPGELFSANAKSFRDLNFKTSHSLCQAYCQCLQLMLYVAENIQQTHGPACPDQIRLVYELVLAKGSKITDQAKKYCGRRYRLTAPKNVPSFGYVINNLILANEKQKDAERELGVCQAEGTKKSHGMNRLWVTTMTKDMYISMINTICKTNPLSAYPDGPPDGGSGYIHEATGFYNPCNIFGWARSIISSLQCNPPACTESSNVSCYVYCRTPADEYGDEEEEFTEESFWQLYKDSSNWSAYIYPHHGQLAWKIELSSFHARDFMSRQFPEIQSISAADSVEKQMFLRHSNLQVLLSNNIFYPSQDRDLTGLPPGELISLKLQNMGNEEERGIFYDEQINAAPVVDAGFGIPEMKAIYIESAKAARTLEEKRTAQLNGISSFFQNIMIQDAVLPPSNKAVISFYNEYLSTHANLSLPRKNTFHNLSSLGNLIASSLVMFESRGKVNTFHISMLTSVLSAFYVWLEDKFQLHRILSGSAMVGKTEQLLMAARLLIVGTWQRRQYISSKSKTGEGEDENDLSAKLLHDQIISIFDELSPAMVGASTNAENQSTNVIGKNAEQEASFKFEQTEGLIIASVLTTLDNGRRVAREIAHLSRSPIWGAWNHAHSCLPAPVQSRNYCSIETNRNRVLNEGLMAVATKTPTESEAEEWTEITQRFQLYHLKTFLLSKMIVIRLLPEIDMMMADILILEILRRCKEKHLAHAEDIRCMQRVRMLVKALVLLEASDALWDHELSPIKDRPWDPKYLVYAAKYLVAKSEHVSIAFGLLQQQYENPVFAFIEHAIYALILEKEMTTNPLYKQQVLNDPLHYQSERDGEQYKHKRNRVLVPQLRDAMNKRDPHSFMMQQQTFIQPQPVQPVQQDVNSTATATRDNIKIFSRYLMNSKVMKSETYPTKEVEEVITTMTEYTNNNQTEPYIFFEPGGYVSIIRSRLIDAQILENGPDGGRYYTHSKLKDAVRETLQHAYAQPKTVLFGIEMNNEAPFLLQTIEIVKGDPSIHPYLYMTMPGFCDIEIKKCLEGFVMKKTKQKKKDQRFKMAHTGKNQYGIIKDDVDDQAARIHNIKIELSEEEFQLTPSNISSILAEQDWKRQLDPGRNKYPGCFDQAYPHVLARAQKHRKRTGTDCSFDYEQTLKKQKKEERLALRSSSSDQVVVQQQQQQPILKEERLRLMEFDEKNPLNPAITCIISQDERDETEEEERRDLLMPLSHHSEAVEIVNPWYKEQKTGENSTMKLSLIQEAEEHDAVLEEEERLKLVGIQEAAEAGMLIVQNDIGNFSIHRPAPLDISMEETDDEEEREGEDEEEIEEASDEDKPVLCNVTFASAFGLRT